MGARSAAMAVVCAARARRTAAALLVLLSCRGEPTEEFTTRGIYRVDSSGPQEVFNFGSNWNKYVDAMDKGESTQDMFDAVNAACMQLGTVLSPPGFVMEKEETPVLQHSTFLDIGCGSGIHSASAAFLGAPRVVSFDLQEGSVQATSVLKDILGRFFKGVQWDVWRADILQQDFRPPEADVVYSWGVLHHTGQMWTAIKNACRAVPRPDDGGGVLFLALYALEVVRDTDYWIRIKKKYLAEDDYNRRQMEREYGWFLLKDAALQGNKNPFGMIAESPMQRGMNFWTDVKDWLGGYPIEFSEAHDVIRFVRQECRLVPARVVSSTVTEFVFVTDPEDPHLVPREDRLVWRWHKGMRASAGGIQLRPPYVYLDFSANRRQKCFAASLRLPPELNATLVKFDLREDGYDFGFGVEVEAERNLEALDDMFEDEEREMQQRRKEWVARFGADGHMCERPGRYFRQPWFLGKAVDPVVVFSTSDGSDPNKNGRRYSVTVEPGTGEPPDAEHLRRGEILYSAADLQ